MSNETRIQKVLSENGIASRRKAEELIQKGKIQINGHLLNWVRKSIHTAMLLP